MPGTLEYSKYSFLNSGILALRQSASHTTLLSVMDDKFASTTAHPDNSNDFLLGSFKECFFAFGLKQTNHEKSKETVKGALILGE